MAEGIKKSDLIEGNAIDDIRSDLDEMAVSLEKTDKQFKSIAKTLKSEINPTLEKTLKGVRKVNEAEIKSEKLLREKLINEEKLKKVKLAQKRIDEVEQRKLIAKNKEEERQAKIKERELAAKEKANKASARAKQLLLDEKNAYKQLTKATNAAQAEFKRLAAQHGVNSKQARNAKVKFDALDKSLRRINKDARDGRRDVGRYAEGWRKAQSALGAVGISIGIGFAMREGLEILEEYDEKIADIMKTTGLLKKDAEELSGDLFSIDTKTSITNLQELVEAGGRLNITGKKNLLEFAAAADQVFVALGDDLEGSAGEIATNIRKISAQFGLESEFGIAEGIKKTGSGINELAATSKASAPAILDFTNRMVGLSDVLELQDVQALGALFDESGQSIEVASSTLLKLLPKLATDYERFAEVAGKTPKEFKKIAEDSPIEALKLVASGAKNSEKGLFSLTKTLESYGVESARATGIVGTLTNNVDRLTELQGISNEAIEEGTSLTDEFNVKNDTLSATLEKAKKKIVEQVIEFDKATGISKKFAAAIAFLAKNFSTILSVGGKLLTFFTIYKTRMLVLNALNGKFGAGLVSIGKAFKSAVSSGKGFKNTIKNVGTSLKNSGSVMTVAIGLVLKLGKAWLDAANKAQFYADVQAAVVASQTKQGEEAQKRVTAREKEFQDRINFLKLERSAGRLTQEEEIRLTKEATEARKAQVQSDIKAVAARKNAALEELRIAKELQKSFDESATGRIVRGSTGTGLGVADESVKKLDDRVVRARANVQGLTTKLEVYRAESDSLTQSVIDLTVSQNENNESTGKGTKAIEEKTKAYKDLSDQIDNILNKGLSLQEIEDDEIAQLEQAAQNVLTRQLTFINDSERLKTMTVEEAAQARILAELEALLERERILELYGRSTIDIEKELSAKRLELAKSGAEEEVKVETDKNEEIFNAYKNLQEALTSVLSDQIDDRIALSKKEQDAAKSQQDFYEALAVNGNITAEKSIAKQIEIQREAEQEQARLEKLKQRVLAISAGIKTYVAEIDSGKSPTQALGSTITNTKILAELLKNINFFEKGTDNAPQGWAVVDEKGSEIITDKKGNIKDFGTDTGARWKYLEAGDKVKTASQSNDILNKFDQIGMSQIVNKAQDHAGNSYDLMVLNDTMKGMRSDMSKLQTKYEVDWAGFKKVVPHFEVKKTKGGDKRTDRYYIG